MRLFALEHSQAAYRLDFVAYGVAVTALLVLLLTLGPRGWAVEMIALATLGLVAWTAMEYALHRFVLHGLQPFRRWHEAHHERPTALISMPTLLSGAAIALVIFCPGWLLGGLWRACAWTLGVLIGYLAYTITHHAAHHWRPGTAWSVRRKQWHAQHHHASKPACYGVTTAFWDHVFGTGLPRRVDRACAP